MKTLNYLLIWSILVVQTIGCSKEKNTMPRRGIRNDTVSSTPIAPPPPPRGVALDTVNADAGFDKIVILPDNSISLIGSASFPRVGIDSIKEVSWQKISGPDQYSLAQMHSFTTLLTALEEGIYLFELTVTTTKNRQARDTVKITAGRLPDQPKEIILNNLTWTSPWFNTVEIRDFYNYVPEEKVFKIFISRHNSTDWIEVPQFQQVPDSPYEYLIMDRFNDFYKQGSMHIFYYGNDMDDKPKVKIVY